jgi:hypothetical protein
VVDWRIPPDEDKVARYYASKPAPVREVALELDAIVRKEIPGVKAGIKWAVPFYVRKWPVCYVSVGKRHVTFGLLHGERIPDASGLLAGTGKSTIRSAKFRPSDPIPKAAVRGWLKASRKFDDSWGED